MGGTGEGQWWGAPGTGPTHLALSIKAQTKGWKESTQIHFQIKAKSNKTGPHRISQLKGWKPQACLRTTW